MALIDPPYAFAPYAPVPELTDVSALQLMQGASLTLTLSPLTAVTSHLLALLVATPERPLILSADAPT